MDVISHSVSISNGILGSNISPQDDAKEDGFPLNL